MHSLWSASLRIASLPSCRITITPSCRPALESCARHQYSVSPLSRHVGLLASVRGRLKPAPFQTHWPAVNNRTYASKRNTVVTTFEQIPDTYHDNDGLAFRERPLSRKDTAAIFGRGVDANAGNWLLRVLHGRRVAGTLRDPGDTADMTPDQLQAEKSALTWLRLNVPVDELHSVRQRVALERELVEGSAILRANEDARLGRYEPNSGDYGATPAGPSGLDSIKEIKKKRMDDREEKARLEEEQFLANGGVKTGTLAEYTSRRQVALESGERSERYKRYLARSEVLPYEPPEMSIFQRLWPSALCVLVVIGASTLLVQVYTPPKNSARLWPDIPPAAATIMGLIGANVVVFLAWRSPPAWRTLNKYFIVVPGYPFGLSMIGNVFSHKQFSHLAWNMAVLFVVGSRLHDEVGRSSFLAVYMTAGTIGSFVSLADWTVRGVFTTSSLGASGAIFGLIAAYAWLHREAEISLWGYWPQADWFPRLTSQDFLLLLLLSELFMVSRLNTRFRKGAHDHWAHIGGAVAGVGSASLLKIRAQRRRERELRRRQEMGLVDRLLTPRP